MSETGSTGRFEAFDANEHYVVIRDDEGYAVWRIDDLEEGDPIRRFSDDDAGYEAAAVIWKRLTASDRRVRGVWLDRLRVTVVVTLVLWLLASSVPIVMTLFEEAPNGFFPGDPTEPFLERVLYVVSAITFDMWVAAAIAYLLLWMDRRRRMGPVSTGAEPG